MTAPTAQRASLTHSSASAPTRAALAPNSQPPPRLALAVPDFDNDTLPLRWPAEGPVVSTFGHRRSGWHGGIDIKAPLGTPVQAAAAGVVTAAGVETRYGLVVKIEHRAGFVTVYAHNDVNLVEVGDRVDAGDLIALVGNTGRATTYHVHFEVRRDGLAYNPLYLLPMPPRIAQVDETAQRPHE
jgi:murein DD-endopeptidase MepM/ murein hydrolase activator NlpD